MQLSVLNGLGWNIYHIWTMDWLDSPNKELEKLLVAIKNAILHKEDKKVIEDTTIKREIEFEKIADTIILNNRAVNYLKCSLGCLGTSEDFYQITSRPKIINVIKKTIEQESPISHNLLSKRVLECWGISRSGSKVDSIINDAISALHSKVTVTLGKKFYWGDNQEPDTYISYRVSNDEDKRTMDDICEQEVAIAIYQIMENQCSLSRDDLVRETGKLFGFSRIGNVIEKSVESGIKYAAAKGWIEKSEDGEKIQMRL